MKICKSCGAQNEDTAVVCEKCGGELGPSQIDLNDVKQTVSVAADKAFSGAKDLAGKINSAVNTTLEHQKEKVNQEVQQQITNAQRTKKSPRAEVSSKGTEYMSSTELWSWLQKSSKRQHFFTEEENTLSQEDYIQKLSQKLVDNHVPASVATREVVWDRSQISQKITYVQPVSEAVNPLSCLVQFCHVGKFTFVEEKTFITPPDLPPVPEKPVTISAELRKRANWILGGILLALAGLLIMFPLEQAVVGIVVLLAGAAMAWFGYSAHMKVSALEEHNKKCAAQELAWSKAWNNWENSIFLHSFQESVNGQISRIYDSVFECIKQLNDEIFAQKDSVEQEESQSMNELEQLIARRKDTYR